ncbi:MAG: hypothetical protein WCD37_07190 [Chloroflexia bacterium]
MKHLRLLLCVLVFASLAGCNSPGDLPGNPTSIPQPAFVTPTAVAIMPDGTLGSPSPADPTAPGATPVPTKAGMIDIPTPSVPPGEAVTATIVAELQGTAIANVDPTSTPDTNGMSPFAGIDGIAVLRLKDMPINGEYWLAYSTGSRRLDDIPQQHFAVAFERANDSWREVSRIELQNPDYMSEGSIMQTDIEPSHAWLSIDGGVGAHGGCFDLLSFDGKDLRNEISGCASSPSAGAVEDLDGDGKGEVVLNASDSYVFCYACGVRRINFSVLRWQDNGLVPVQATELPPDAPAELKASNDRAVELFKHELMKDALVKIEEAYALDAANSTVQWNRVLIKLHADARQEHVRESNYPLLTNIFYGHYPAALDVLRGYPIDQVMLRAGESPLVVGTPAEGNADLLVSYITTTTDLALQALPDLAAAHYLRGWAYYLAGGRDSLALAGIEQAAALDPNDPLFTESLKRLRP